MSLTQNLVTRYPLNIMTIRDLLLASVDEAYDQPSWHGANLKGALRGLRAPAVDWRPAPGRHSIRENVVHAAYWKFRVRRRLTGDEAAAFTLEGKDWFPSEPARSWARELKMLSDEHRALRAAVEGFPATRLNRPLSSNGRTAAWLVRGIAAHDLYHAGQIMLLKRLQGS